LGADSASIGWERIAPVFERVAQICAGGHVTLQLNDPLIRVVGDLAYEIGVESGGGTIAGRPRSIEQRVTNIYRREPAGWKMVHRHADINAEERASQTGHALRRTP
jgi:ketosteroid isomerase-like protein